MVAPVDHQNAAALAPTTMESVDAWLARRGQTLDIVLASLALLVLGLSGVALGSASGSRIADATVVLASLGMPVAMAVRRRWPVGSAVAVNALALLHFAAGDTLLPVDLLIYGSVYSTTVHAPAGRVGSASPPRCSAAPWWPDC
ncbi:hypothetical protein C8046_05910 [Serinibacter arcticus]|uniref:DUF7134 domain-containing protein n=1 Tax=Serinibacter arcticus TaxID=1655435 RepID=A0A2U1ZTF1_9MICO|nr:hypothetical protein C8046_05910 [Serinibacter arcticus]